MHIKSDLDEAVMVNRAVAGMVRFAAGELAAAGNAEDAEAMAAYMKTDMPFYGVKSPVRALVLREMTARFPVATAHDYRGAVRSLWSQPHREEKYLAIDVARAYPEHVTMESVPLYRDIIVTGAWWDFVDPVAADLIGKVLRDEPEQMAPTLDDWIDDDDMWLRRTAILSRLRHKSATDRERLFSYCLRRAGEKEFFIRKAIGWALREYAKTDPAAVRSFVLEHRHEWSGLTYREATKHLDVPTE